MNLYSLLKSYPAHRLNILDMIQSHKSYSVKFKGEFTFLAILKWLLKAECNQPVANANTIEDIFVRSINRMSVLSSTASNQNNQSLVLPSQYWPDK